jgi:hypothetical protein
VAEVVLATDALTTFWAAIGGASAGGWSDITTARAGSPRGHPARVEEARRAGYGAVSNLRLTILEIGGRADERPASRVAVLAAGTACAAAADPARAAWLDDVRAPEPLPGARRTVL